MNKTQTSRRNFFKATSAAFLGSMIIPRHVIGQNPPSDKVIVGVVGCGTRGDELLREAMRTDTIRVAAIADCDRDYLLHARANLDEQYEIERIPAKRSPYKLLPQEQPKGATDAYNDYRRILERSDIDAVIAAVPDHWHSKVYIDSMNAGKDVYGEKPLALTIEQGRDIVRTVEATGRIFQTGSQQRSDEKFRKACEYVRNGALGKIQHVDIAVGGGEVAETVPDSPPPDCLDWDLWLGPAPKVPFNVKRCHYNWRWFFDYSGGQVTDWGVHHCDICQWGLGMDHTGPRFVEGWAKTQKPSYYETFTEFEFTFTYANGITALLHHRGNLVTFIGEKGKIKVNREILESDPKDLLEQPLPGNYERLYVSDNHMQNWLDCIKSRKQPICAAEIGHRSVTLLHIANICGRLGRKLEWDAENEVFVNDQEANTYLSRKERPPYHHLAGV